MEIRFLTPAEGDQWLRLRMEALEGAPEAFSASPDEYRSLSREEVNRRLWPDGDAFVLGAFEDGCLQGMAGFRARKVRSLATRDVYGVYT